MERWSLARGNHVLHGLRWRADAPRLRLLVLHGLAEHAQRYADAATCWTASGIETWSFDQVAHGTTAGVSGLGRPPVAGLWRTLVRDCVAVASHVGDQSPALPLAVLGHSMGSVVVQRAMLSSAWPAPAVVLTGTVAAGVPRDIWRTLRTALDEADTSVDPRAARTALLASMFKAYRAAFPDDPDPLSWVTTDAIERASRQSDPLCAVVPTARFWRDLLGGYQRLARMQARPLPTRVRDALLISGRDDPVHAAGVALREVASRLRRSGVEDVSVDTVAGVRHAVLHDRGRELSARYIGRWLLARRYANGRSA